MALAFENKLFRRKLLNYCLKISLEFQIGKTKKGKRLRGSLTFSLNLAFCRTQKLREIIAQSIGLKRCFVILKIR